MDNDQLFDLVGHLLIVQPVQYLQGQRDAVRVNVADLNANTEARDWGVMYRDTLWFDWALVCGLRRQLGEQVLGWMAQGIGEPGRKPNFQLTDAMGSPDAVRAAQQWLNAHPEFDLYPEREVVITNRACGPYRNLSKSDKDALRALGFLV